MKISNSRFDCWHRCPYQHWLRYYKGLAAKLKGRPLSFGSDMHTLLEFRHDPESLALAQQRIGEAFYQLPQGQQDKLGGEQYLIDLSCIFEDYQAQWKNTPAPSCTERKFTIKADTYRGEPIIFNGVIDELYKSRRNGKKVLRFGEHKTFGKKPDINTLVMNTQKNLYAKACFFKTGVLPEEVMWDHICSTPAKAPVYLEKSKRFSTSKTTQVTPASFLRACSDYGITDKAILAQAKQYEPNVSNFFFRTPQDIIPRQVDLVWEGFLYSAREIIRHGHKNKTRYLTRDCYWCEYHDICKSELLGSDASDIIKYNFVERDHTDEMDLIAD